MTSRLSQRKCFGFLLDPLFLIGALMTSAFLFLHPRISALVYERSNFDNLIRDVGYSESRNDDDDFIKLSLPMKNVVQNPISVLLEQDESWLIKFIRKNYLFPPSKLPYNLNRKLEELKDDPSFKKAKEVYKLLKEKENGTFVEYRAGDGEHHSATLTLETQYGWRGALIEANPKNFEKLLSKHRKVWSMSAGLTPFPFPKKMTIDMRTDALIIHNEESTLQTDTYRSVQSFPLYSALLALNMTKLDYLSLKSNDFDQNVLSTVPWNKVEIKTLSIDCKETDFEKKSSARAFLGRLGYTEKFHSQNEFIIFVNSNYLN